MERMNEVKDAAHVCPTNAAPGPSSYCPSGLQIQTVNGEILEGIPRWNTHSACISCKVFPLTSKDEILLFANMFGVTSLNTCRTARYRMTRAGDTSQHVLQDGAKRDGPRYADSISAFTAISFACIPFRLLE